MYGFLRANRCQLQKSERDAYCRLYCGQCAALGRDFGYVWRRVVSYDAAFLGLLIVAQQEGGPAQSKAWCGMLPRKVGVHSPDGEAVRFSSAFAVALEALRAQDTLAEHASFFRKARWQACEKSFNKAMDILGSMGFPIGLFAATADAQARVECREGLPLADYAEPTARFLAEAFRFTARLAAVPQNETTLYESGYHAGRLIYLADSCIDMLDDMERREFNALLASYGKEGIICSENAAREITTLAGQSLECIKEALEKLDVSRWNSLVRHVLLQGLPGTLHNKVKTSGSRFTRSMKVIEQYTPHAALASVLCFVSASNANAGWHWGTKFLAHMNNGLNNGSFNATDQYNALYGWYFTNPTPASSRGESTVPCEACLNPCAYYTSYYTGPGAGNCGAICGHITVLAFQLGVKAFIYLIIYVAILNFNDSIIKPRRKNLEEKKELDLKAKNAVFIESIKAKIQPIHMAVETVADKLGIVFNSDYLEKIDEYFAPNPKADFRKDSNLKILADAIGQRALNDQKRLEKALEKYGSIMSTVLAGGYNLNKYQQAEYDFNRSLMLDYVKTLLSERRWNDFDAVLDAIAKEIKTHN